LLLGHQADERDYTVAARILEDLGVRSLRLLTNNPDKLETLRVVGLQVTERVPIEPTIYAENAHYLFTKVTRMHHMLNLGPVILPLNRNENAEL
jgi:3,4-dihydroxy 2-butanone 4-phosphate synthase/GTP cyclohydrolase II